MFLISKFQIEKLNAIKLGGFKKKVEMHLRENFALIIDKLNSEELDLFIDNGINKAKKYMLQTEYAILVYFNAMLTLGINFEFEDDNKWILNIFNDSSMSPDRKLFELINFVNK